MFSKTKLVALSLFTLVVFGFSTTNAQGFVIGMKYNNVAVPNMNTELVWNIDKGNCKLQMKTQYEGRNVSSFFYTDAAGSSIKMLEENPANQKKIFYTININSLKPDARFDYKRGRANVLNETKTIAGISCKKVEYTTDKFTCEFWLAESLPDVKSWSRFFQSYPELNAIAEAGLSGFPLASTVKDLSGNLLVSFDATEVKPTQFSASDFTVPSDYIDASKLERKK